MNIRRQTIDALVVMRAARALPFNLRQRTQLPESEAYRSVQRHPEVITFPGLLIWRIGGDLFFASIGHVRDALQASLAARAEVQCVLFDFGAVNFIDVTASDELFGFIKQLENDHITVAFARVRDVVRDDMRLAGIEPLVGANSFHERITDGVTAWQRSRTPLSDRSAPAD